MAFDLIRLCCGNIANVAGFVAVTGFCITSLTMSITTNMIDPNSEFAQIIYYGKNVFSSITGVAMVLIWKYYRSHYNLTTNIIRNTIDYNALLWFICYSMLGSIIYSISIILGSMILQGYANDFISGLQPLVVVILSVIFLQQKFNLWIIISCTMTIIGVLFFELSKNYNGAYSLYNIYCIGLIIICSIGYSLHMIIIKKVYMYCLEKDKVIIGNILYITFQSSVTVVLFCWIMWSPNNVMNIFKFMLNEYLWIGFVNFVCLAFQFIAIALNSPFYVCIASTIVIIPMHIRNYVFNLYSVFGILFIELSFCMLDTIKPKCIQKIITFSKSKSKYSGKSKSKSETKSTQKDIFDGLLVNVLQNNNYEVVRNI